MTDVRLFRILIVDDEPHIASGLASTLASRSYAVATAGDVEEALAAFRRQPYDLVITDLKMPGTSGGLELVRAVKHEWPETWIIVITAYGTIRTAVEAMRLGAHDYLTKPLDMDLLQTHVRDAFERYRLREENRALREQLANAGEIPEMIGQSAAFRILTTEIRRVADADCTVLIEGESGSGKELVARAIHGLSARRSRPFVAANVAAMPETLIESELFGYEKGAFSGALRRKPGWFEMARGGTLLLDELDEMPLKAQVDLLRVLEQRELRRLGGEEVIPVDVQLVVAVQQEPSALVDTGKLRKDLYYRLNIVPLRVPPLRERREDIPLLVEHFLRMAERRLRREPKQVTGAAMRALLDYAWPGNVRQLRNYMERLAVTVDGPTIRAEELPQEMRNAPAARDVVTLEAAVEEAEKAVILAALGRCNYHREHTAQLLGISVRTLHNKLNRYDLQ
jgi:two-component system NtrC family response regulator